jgi:glycosyltransferase involved in cell wall biosynthesis
MVGATVVVPTCNKKESVTQALQSVLAQTYRNFEIAIVDDGSTDGTPAHVFRGFCTESKVVEVLSRLNPTGLRPFAHHFTCNGITVKYHYHTNRGLGAARNRGIRHARGTYIAFLEAEDIWDPLHLETQIAFFEANRWARICHVGERHVRDGLRPHKPRKGEKASGWVFPHALEGCPTSISCTMIHRSCFAECGAFDENLPACEDYDLWLRLAARYPIYYVDGPEVVRRSPRPEISQHAWTWDRFRVYALEKAFQGGHLNPEQRFLVSQEIVNRCERLVEGFRRQKSEERANFYERKRKRFSQEVRKLRAAYPPVAATAPVRLPQAPARRERERTGRTRACKSA